MDWTRMKNGTLSFVDSAIIAAGMLNSTLSKDYILSGEKRFCLFCVSIVE